MADQSSPIIGTYPAFAPTEWGGGAIVWVGNASGLPAGDGSRRTYPLSSVFGSSGALAKIASRNKAAGGVAGGGTIYVLPGHAESLTAANVLSTIAGATALGITIIGLGRGTRRPAFTWTAALSSLAVDVAGFAIKNCQLFLAGPHAAGTAVTVAAPITISAAGVELSDNDIWWGFDADQIVTIGITTTAAADNLTFNRNKCRAETAAVPTTTFLRLTGTDNLEIDGTHIVGPGSTTAIGPVQQLTTGSLKATIKNSQFQNTLAASTIAFTAIAGCTGSVDNCGFGVLAAGNGLTTGSGLQVTNSKTAVAAAAGADTTG